MQTYHVNLSSTSTGHAGTVADPMSWADVRALLLSIPTYTVQPDGTRLLSAGAVVDMVFRCRGTGLILNAENSVNLTNLDFSSVTGGIRFVADDPGQYGLPVIGTPVFGAGSTALQPNTTWFKLTNSVGVRVDFTSFLFDINQPFGSDGYNLVEINGGIGATVNVSNNLFVEQGVGHRFVYVHGTDATARVVVSGNTVCFGTTSAGAQEFVRAESGRAFVGLNYAAQASASTAVVLFTTATQQIYTHANAFALKSSSLLYNGVAPLRYSIDTVGLNMKTQGIFNVYALDATQPAQAMTNGIKYSEASGFWPVHGGLLLGTGLVTIPDALDLGMTKVDAFGYGRPAAAQDSGAFQKSGRTEAATVHVNLSALSTGGSGTEDAPVGLAEFVIDYSRRAPVDYSLTYVLRGSNAANPITKFDLGPLSPNAAANDVTYTGAGSILLTGYKTYNRSLPILSAARIVPNAKLSVVIERTKLEFTNGTDFIVGDIPSSGELRLRACVIRSRTAAIGMFVRYNVGTAMVHLRGCTVIQGHSNGTSAGIFYHAGPGCTAHLCAINLKNQVEAGTGRVDVRACSISTGGAGTAVWTNATVDAYSNLNAVNAFTDPDNADYAAADYRLLPSSSAIGILPDVASIVGDYVDLSLDCLGMIRSAYPNGSKAGDAGAYEYDFYVPEPDHRYLDIGKARTGAGTPTDRWSPADLQAWCDNLRDTGSLLDRTLLVHTSRTGTLDLLLQGIDANANGALVFVADGTPPLWESGSRGNIVAADSNGLSVSVRGMMLRNETGAEIVYARNCVNTKFDFANSIFDNKRMSTTYHVHLVTQPGSTDVITVTGAQAQTLTFRPGVDFVLGATLAATAVAIAEAINEHGIAVASAFSDTVSVTVPVAGSVVVTSSYTAVLSDAIVEAETVLMRGCSINDEFSGESGIVSVGVKATTANVGYSAFQGHAFSTTTKSGNAIQAPHGISLDNRTNDFVNVIASGVTDTGSVKSTAHLFVDLRAVDTNLDSFQLSGFDSVDVVDASTLPLIFQGPDNQIDINARFRSRVYVNPTQNKYDAGAYERTYLDQEAVFDGTVGNPITEVTSAGYALNSRALSGDVHFSLVGYAIARGGYVYWDPTKPQPALDPGSQAHASFRVTSNTITTESVTVRGTLGVVRVAAGTDFDAGLTVEDTANAIATALRASPLFNRGFWCTVSGADVHIYSWRFGTASAGCVLSLTGSALAVTQAFVTGTELLGVVDQVYPATGYAPWFGTEKPDPRSIDLVVRLESGAFVYGELVVIANVHASPFADEVGKNYVYARARMPVSVKHARRTLVQHLLFAF